MITAILAITERMEQALKADNDEEFQSLLAERDAIMQKVDQYRAEHPDQQYSEAAKQKLEKALALDKQMAPLLEERLLETRTSLNKIKQTKEVSKKYHPYMNQTNGVFIDSKK